MKVSMSYLKDGLIWSMVIFFISAPICLWATGDIKISVDISHILGNLITVIFNYQILRKPLKILSL